MTDQNRIQKAASILAEAYRDKTRPERLPDDCAPSDAREALAVQEALTGLLGEEVAGWKVGPPRDGVVLRGAIYRSRVFESPASLIAAEMPLLGVEAEIAYRFDKTFHPRASDYGRDEIAAAVTAFAAIEIVDSRFRSYHDAPFLDRAADLMSNGAFVVGTSRSDLRAFDFTSVEVILSVSGSEILRRVGGHASGDPILPAVDLVNDMTRTTAVPAGTFMTTGTFTGLSFARPGDTVVAEFVNFGKVEVTFET